MLVRERLLALLRIACFVAAVFGSTSAIAADFRLEDYFRGSTYADGQFWAINGINRTFKVRLSGRWNGKTLTLVEDFVYDDGERDRKTWRFTKVAEGQYSGTREDVVGSTTVRIVGNTARFSYAVYLDSKNQTNRVRFFDKMVLRRDGTVLNSALVTKFGFPVGRTRVEFRQTR